MNKKELIHQFILLIEETLSLAIESQKNTVDYVIDEDNKPENQYDTRGLEASYLARGQAERVAELKECLNDFKNAVVRNYTEDTPLGPTALVEVMSLNSEETKTFFFMPKGGGLTLNYVERQIQVVTASSPIGQALVGQKVGEIIRYRARDRDHEYEIQAVY